MRDAAHLIRLAAVLAVGILLFAFARQQLVPAGFGKYGHFRAGALDDVRSLPIVHAGRQACAMCHDDVVKVLEPTRHGRIGCEACHGPQAQHANAPDPSAAKPQLPDTAVLCARCHEGNSARPKWLPQVASQEHSGGEPCKTCHEPHSPKLGGG